jgi:hypothetical protein
LGRKLGERERDSGEWELEGRDKEEGMKRRRRLAKVLGRSSQDFHRVTTK